jgi:hypothetical protein
MLSVSFEKAPCCLQRKQSLFSRQRGNGGHSCTENIHPLYNLLNLLSHLEPECFMEIFYPASRLHQFCLDELVLIPIMQQKIKNQCITYRNVQSFDGASSTMKHDGFGFQCGICNRSFAHMAFNHSTKSSHLCQFMITQATNTSMWWKSNTINVNRWYFISIVPNVASIKINLLWLNQSMAYCQRNNHVVGVPNLWKPMEYLHKFTNHNNPNQQNL